MAWELPEFKPGLLARQAQRLAAHRQKEGQRTELRRAVSAAEGDLEETVARWAGRRTGPGAPLPRLSALLAGLPVVWPAAAATVRAGGLTDRAAVRKCYLRCIRLVHPDKVAAAAEAVGPSEAAVHTALAQKIFGVLHEAYQTFQGAGSRG